MFVACVRGCHQRAVRTATALDPVYILVVKANELLSGTKVCLDYYIRVRRCMPKVVHSQNAMLSNEQEIAADTSAPKLIIPVRI